MLDPSAWQPKMIQTEWYPDSHWLQLVYFEDQLCGVVAHEEALLSSFDEVMETSEALLDGTFLRLRHFELADEKVYLTTEKSWKIPNTNTGLYCISGCLLAVDPAIDDRGDWWKEKGIASSGYESIVPEDRPLCRTAHNKILQGGHVDIKYRAQCQSRVIDKHVRMEAYESCSAPLLQIQHYS